MPTEPAASDLGEPGRDIERLRETLREAERVIDHEARNFESLDRKSERLIAVAVAVLAGGVVLGGFAVQGSVSEGDRVFVVALTAGGALTVAALATFMNAYAGFRTHTDVFIGPKIEWLVEKANAAAWTLAEHYLSVLDGFSKYQGHHARQSIRLARLRRTGLLFLLAGVVVFAFGFVYIIWRRM